MGRRGKARSKRSVPYERRPLLNSKASEAAETREGPVDLRSAEQMSECESARRDRYGCGHTRRSGGPSQCGADERMRIGPKGAAASHLSPVWRGGLVDKLVFRNPDVVEAAKNLLGCSLFTRIDGHLTGGIITETESYAGVEDKASHAYGGRRTLRTEVMYRQGGIAYVYLCYGVHALFNVVTGDAGVPHGVLVRAIQPTHGIEIMMQRRKKTRLEPSLTGGPGALTAALGITVRYTGTPLDAEPVWVAPGIRIKEFKTTPRIGIDYAEECVDLPYRFVAVLPNNNPAAIMKI